MSSNDCTQTARARAASRLTLLSPVRKRASARASFALLGLALAAGCSSPALYAEYRGTLKSAQANVQQGANEKAAKQLERFLADTYPTRDTYLLQRFYADYLLTLAHEAASFEKSFLSEPGGSDRGGFSVDGGSDGSRRPSPLGHVVAVTYHGAYGRDAFKGALNKPTEVEGQALLPESLKGVGIEDAFRHLALTMVSVYSRLNFEERIPEIIRGIPELQEFALCEELLERLHVHEAARPWIYRGIFDYMKSSDERAAYKFGVRAREFAANSRGTMGRSVTDRIADWIENESAFVFVSQANVPFNRDFEGEDPSSGDRLIDFRAVPRDQWNR